MLAVRWFSIYISRTSCFSLPFSVVNLESGEVARVNRLDSRSIKVQLFMKIPVKVIRFLLNKRYFQRITKPTTCLLIYWLFRNREIQVTKSVCECVWRYTASLITGTFIARGNTTPNNINFPIFPRLPYTHTGIEQPGFQFIVELFSQLLRFRCRDTFGIN